MAEGAVAGGTGSRGGEPTRGLLLVGVGGQGVVSASNIVASALMLCGHDVKETEVHGMAQRGGIVYSHVRYGPRVASPLLARGSADLLVAFEWAEVLRWLPFLRPGGGVVAAVDRIVPPAACVDRRAWASRYPALDGAPLARWAGERRFVEARRVAEELGNAKAAGSVLLGVASRLMDVPVEAWEEAFRARVPARLLEVNLACFEAGREAAFPAAPPPAPSPAPRPRAAPRIEITAAWCKGCDICVRVCPERCLALDEDEKVVVVAPGSCTGCRLCELLCPDFAIAVRPGEEERPREPGPARAAVGGSRG